MSFTRSELPDPTLIIDPITEERASRTLYRIELLRRIREQVLPHPQLSERLKLCQPSADLPEWWECGRHDRDLLLGASKHGVSRTDYHILNDTTLAFLEAHQRFTSQRGGAAGVHGDMMKLAAEANPAAPLLTPGDLESVAAAASLALNGGKEEAGVEEKEVKTEEETAEKEVKTETEGDIPCEEIKTPDLKKENEGELEEKKDEIASSPKKELKKEDEAQPDEEQKEKEEEQTEKTPKPEDDQDQDTTEEKKSQGEALEEQKETPAEPSEHPDTSSPEAQQDKPAEETNGEEKENAESPKSLKSADTEKSPEEEEEERMDEDDKSEKSSQAEG